MTIIMNTDTQIKLKTLPEGFVYLSQVCPVINMPMMITSLERL